LRRDGLDLAIRPRAGQSWGLVAGNDYGVGDGKILGLLESIGFCGVVVWGCHKVRERNFDRAFFENRQSQNDIMQPQRSNIMDQIFDLRTRTHQQNQILHILLFFRFSQGLAKSETAHSPLFSIFAGTCEIRNCTFSCFVLVPNFQPRTLGPRFKLMANSVQF
jgi:hypothetical protein